VSTAIDRYVHMTVSGRVRDRFLLKHLEWEEVDEPGQVRHPILRAALTHHWDGGPVEHAPDPERVRAALADAPELPFGLDGDGCVELR
jgi:hypothetical protein